MSRNKKRKRGRPAELTEFGVIWEHNPDPEDPDRLAQAFEMLLREEDPPELETPRSYQPTLWE